MGDVPERPPIEAAARDSNACDAIKFLGKQEQMEDILPIADLFLLTSEYESFGLAALEALAAEVPVISTNAGGLPEIINALAQARKFDIENIVPQYEKLYQRLI